MTHPQACPLPAAATRFPGASGIRMRMALGGMVVSLGLCGACVRAQQPAATGLVDAARGRVAIPQATDPPPLTNSVNDDQRRPRNYDMQPPTVPHRVDGYQIDKNFNKCLDCHARDKTAFSLAIPVSATHYIDRDGKALQQISTRRYFCLQCHFAQEPVQPIVGNGFENVDALAKKAAGAAQAGKK